MQETTSKEKILKKIRNALISRQENPFQNIDFKKADAENLPFPDNSLDCVLSIRFMHHIDSATRIRILRDMARVSRHWVIIDYRHRYSFRYRMRAVKLKLGLTRRVLPRVSRDELEHEFSTAGIKIVKVIPVGKFSDKWIVVGDCRP